MHAVTTRRVAFFVLACLLIAGCATHYAPSRLIEPYGFWSGIWHGFIFSFALVGLLVSWLCSLLGFDVLSSVELIGRPNTGFIYYLGFSIGLFVLLGGAGSR